MAKFFDNFSPTGGNIFEALSKGLASGAQFAGQMESNAKRKAMQRQLANMGVQNEWLPVESTDVAPVAKGYNEGLPQNLPGQSVFGAQDKPEQFLPQSDVNQTRDVMTRGAMTDQEVATDRYADMTPEDLLQLYAMRQVNKEGGDDGVGSGSGYLSKLISLRGQQTLPDIYALPGGKETVNALDQEINRVVGKNLMTPVGVAEKKQEEADARFMADIAAYDKFAAKNKTYTLKDGRVIKLKPGRLGYRMFLSETGAKSFQ
jgi:hypothetical protein